MKNCDIFLLSQVSNGVKNKPKAKSAQKSFDARKNWKTRSKTKHIKPGSQANSSKPVTLTSKGKLNDFSKFEVNSTQKKPGQGVTYQ